MKSIGINEIIYVQLQLFLNQRIPKVVSQNSLTFFPEFGQDFSDY